MEAWEVRIDEQVARIEAEQIRIRRYLHAHPEASGEEVETTKFLAAKLREAGLAPRVCKSGDGRDVGLIVDLAVGSPPPESPLIALRCDLDALKLPDLKTVEYASLHPGLAHACGHDAHAAMLLGTVMAVVGLKNQAAEARGQESANSREPRAESGESEKTAAIRRSGSPHSALRSVPCEARLRLLFQPAEETSDGARWLIEQGAMQGVSAILGLHVDPERPYGQVGIRYGVLTANCDEVEITIEGHGGHAARPHHSVDPIAAAAHLVSTFYEFLPRAIDSRDPSVFTVGKIVGGYAPNVIPERVELFGTLRTIDPESHRRLQERVEQICIGVERSSGAKIRVWFTRPLKSVRNDPRIAAVLEDAARRILGAENTVPIDRPSMGGEDFSAYLDYAPGALLRLGCADPGNHAPPFLHSSFFDIDERTLALGTRILLRAALLLASQAPSNV